MLTDAVLITMHTALVIPIVIITVGGDEFIMLLPGLDDQAAQVVVDDIQHKLEGTQEQFSDASIALGHIAKTEPGQDISELIHLADQLMYSQKKYDRRRGN